MDDTARRMLTKRKMQALSAHVQIRPQHQGRRNEDVSQPLVSIIVPIYKIKESYLRQCIDSLVSQTLRDIEIILVEDGSPDDCGKICDEYGQKDSRIVVIHQKNQGVSVARNNGMDAARSEYIMFVDADDWLEPDCCEHVVSVAREKKCDIVYFQREINDEIKNRTERYPKKDSFPLETADLQRIQQMAVLVQHRNLNFDVVSPWAKVYCRASLCRNDLKFPVGIRKGQDLLFNIYCLEYFENAYYCDYIGYHYRVNTGSVGQRYNPKILDIELAYLHEMERFISDKHNGEKIYERGLGNSAISIQVLIAKTLFFHPDHFITKKQFDVYMQRYYNDPVVKRYIDKADIRDCKSLKKKILFILLTGRHTFLYYYLYYMYAILSGARA